MPEDPYSDPVTGVLYNKLGLGTAAELEAAEREITQAALILLDESPVSPTCDLPQVQEIHKRIFGDIYEWAGLSRTVAVAKGFMFCLPQYMDSSAAAIFRELRDEDCLCGLRHDAFVSRLAHYLREVNALHPFREGNGRAQRAFFGQLARDAGFTLAWQHLDAARNVEASAAIMRGDPEPMRDARRARQGRHLTSRFSCRGAAAGG
jgi:cell filamentation protein